MCFSLTSQGNSARCSLLTQNTDGAGNRPQRENMNLTNTKLIITDLDGTLFTTDKRLPPDFDDVLAEMNRRGIAFAVATGRNLEGIIHYFTACALCDH